MESMNRRILKELKNIQLNDNLILLKPVDESDLYHWVCVVSSTLNEQSLYKDIKYQLNIELPVEYPLVPPRIRFNFNKQELVDSDICSFIPHSNVDAKTGEICLNILTDLDNWSPAWTLQYVIEAVILLIDNQEPDSPLNIDVANIYRCQDTTALKSLIEYYGHI